MIVLDHIHLRVADLEASRRFYRACLAALGEGFDADAPGHFAAGPLYVDVGPPGQLGERHRLALVGEGGEQAQGTGDDGAGGGAAGGECGGG